MHLFPSPPSALDEAFSPIDSHTNRCPSLSCFQSPKLCSLRGQAPIDNCFIPTRHMHSTAESSCKRASHHLQLLFQVSLESQQHSFAVSVCPLTGHAPIKGPNIVSLGRACIPNCTTVDARLLAFFFFLRHSLLFFS